MSYEILWYLCHFLLFTIAMVKGKSSKIFPKVAKSAQRITTITKEKPSFVDISSSSHIECIRNTLLEASNIKRTRGGWSVADGLKHLIRIDARFGEIIVRYGIPEIYTTEPGSATASPIPDESSGNHFLALLKIIIYQQLSAKSAEPIYRRFVAALNLKPGKTIDPSEIRKAKFECTVIDGKRKILLNGSISGLSEAKAAYIKDLTDHFLNANCLQGVDLSNIGDEELRAKLIAVKGLGPWSVDMFMLFNLQRPNVLPAGDLVVRKGIAHFFGYTEKHFEIKKNQALIPELCKSWSPYCSLATYYMWRMMAPDQQGSK